MKTCEVLRIVHFTWVSYNRFTPVRTKYKVILFSYPVLVWFLFSWRPILVVFTFNFYFPTPFLPPSHLSFPVTVFQLVWTFCYVSRHRHFMFSYLVSSTNIINQVLTRSIRTLEDFNIRRRPLLVLWYRKIVWEFS